MASKELVYKTFTWKGTDKRGDKIKGKVISENRNTAETQLRSQHIDISELKEVSSFLAGGAKKKVKPGDVVLFMRQVSTMVSAGIPLVQALENVAIGIEHLQFRAIILSVHRDVSSGNSLADSLQKHPKLFDSLICNLIKTGEVSGTLDVILKQIADYLERMQILKGRVKKALFYPVTVFVVAITIAAMLLIFIVPQFSVLFKSFDAPLPLPTQIVISMSDTLQEYWYLFLGGFAAIIVSFLQAKKRSEPFRRKLDQFSIKVALFGSLMQKAVIARIARTLSIMLAAGIPLVDALYSVSLVTGNRIFSEAILKVREDVSAGMKMHTALGATKLFPPMLLQMVSVGEKSGSLEEMLKKAADYFDEQVNTAVDGLSTLIEPLMLILLGLIIGGFVISMYLPIFKLGTIL